jgi:hypothetical protein
MRAWILAGAMTTAMLATGCEAPIVGYWRSDKQLENGKHSTLDIYSDLTGEAMFWATPSVDHTAWNKLKFDVSWEDYGDQFDLNLDCTGGPCEGADFFMTCQVIEEDPGGDEKLDCEANRMWKNYPMQWERNED